MKAPQPRPVVSGKAAGNPIPIKPKNAPHLTGKSKESPALPQLKLKRPQREVDIKRGFQANSNEDDEHQAKKPRKDQDAKREQQRPEGNLMFTDTDTDPRSFKLCDLPTTGKATATPQKQKQKACGAAVKPPISTGGEARVSHLKETPWKNGLAQLAVKDLVKKNPSLVKGTQRATKSPLTPTTKEPGATVTGLLPRRYQIKFMTPIPSSKYDSMRDCGHPPAKPLPPAAPKQATRIQCGVALDSAGKDPGEPVYMTLSVNQSLSQRRSSFQLKTTNGSEIAEEFVFFDFQYNTPTKRSTAMDRQLRVFVWVMNHLIELYCAHMSNWTYHRTTWEGELVLAAIEVGVGRQVEGGKMDVDGLKQFLRKLEPMDFPNDTYEYSDNNKLQADHEKIRRMFKSYEHVMDWPQLHTWYVEEVWEVHPDETVGMVEAQEGSEIGEEGEAQDEDVQEPEALEEPVEELSDVSGQD